MTGRRRDIENAGVLLDFCQQHSEARDAVLTWLAVALDDPYVGALQVKGATFAAVMPDTRVVVTYLAPRDYLVLRIISVEEL